MTRVLAISDIHGCLDEFKELLNKINLTKEDTLVLLGDYIDRGEKSIGVLLHIMSLKNKGYNIIALKGNHEQMFLDAVYGKREDDICHSLSCDYTLQINGTANTILKFLRINEGDRVNILRFIKQMPLYYYIENKFIFVHAGLYVPDDYNNYKIEDILDMQHDENVLWDRDNIEIQQFKNNECKIVFGHTPTQSINKNEEAKIYYGEDKIGIDCGCVFKKSNGRLACLDLTNMIEYYV